MVSLDLDVDTNGASGTVNGLGEVREDNGTTSLTGAMNMLETLSALRKVEATV